MSSYQSFDVESGLQVAEVATVTPPRNNQRVTRVVAGLGVAAVVGTVLLSGTSPSASNVEAMNAAAIASPVHAVRPALVASRQQQGRQRGASVQPAAYSRQQAASVFEGAHIYTLIEPETFQDSTASSSSSSSSSMLFNAGAFAAGAMVVGAAINLLTPGTATASEVEDAYAAALSPINNKDAVYTRIAKQKLDPKVAKAAYENKKFDKEGRKSLQTAPPVAAPKVKKEGPSLFASLQEKFAGAVDATEDVPATPAAE